MFKIEFPQELINEYVLSKQHLKKNYKSKNFIELIDDILGLSASLSLTPYFSTLARFNLSFSMKFFNRFIKNKKFIRMKAMRNNLLILTKDLSEIIKVVYCTKKNNNSDDVTLKKLTLVSSYIYAYGPVSIEDIIWWTGFSKSEIKKIISYIDNKIIAVKIEKNLNNYYMLKTDYEQMINWRPEKKMEIHFLPAQDNYVMGYYYRERLTNHSKDLKKIFNKKGNSEPVILINGKIEGLWKLEENNKISFELLDNSTLNFIPLIKQEKERIENLL